MKKVLEEYKIRDEILEINVKIEGEEGATKTYILELPQISKATDALLDDIKEQLVVEVEVSPHEILDPNVLNKLKDRFRVKAEDILKQRLPMIKEFTKKFLVDKLIRDMLGLGDIEFSLNDIQIEEIVINSSNESIRIYHKKYGWLETNMRLRDEAQIQNYANIIARRVGRQVTNLNPLLDAHLVTGDRANAVLYPIATKGHSVTLRKFARDPWTVTDFIENKTTDPYIMALIWLAMQYEMNILISGGTASGKTSFLNVVLPFIPPNQRIVSIEDTRELQLPHYLYWAPLVTRSPNPEGKGEVTMLDLLVNSLRMRPDRIILGEVRRKRDAEVLFESMHTGHSVYATVHANTVSETIQRLVNPPIEVSENLLEAVHLNVVMFRDRRRGFRRLYQVGEMIPYEEGGQTRIKAGILFRWKPSTDTMVQHSTSSRLFEELTRHTGLSMSELNKDLTQKETILHWMLKNKIRDIEKVGKVFREYYLEKENVVKLASGNSNPERILGTK